MFERPLRNLFAAFGMELLPREALERERLASARAAEALELRLKLANEERASLRSEVGRLQADSTEVVGRLWGKLEKEQKRAAAALAEARRAAAVAADLVPVRREELFALRSGARAAETLEVRLKQANEELASLRSEVGRLQADFTDVVGQLWAKVEKEQKRAAAAMVEARRAAAVVPEVVPAGREQLDAMRSKLHAEGAMKAAMKARLREQTSLADALAAEAEARRAEMTDLEQRLAAHEAGITRQAADDLMAALGAFPARRSELAADRLVESLLHRSGLRERAPDDAAAYYRLGRNLQIQGAAELAAAAYRKVGPRISEFLAQAGPDGRPVTGPDFLIIGAPRAGTTWLKRTLSHHPDVMMFAGEPQFFAMTSYLGPENYVRRFSAAGARFLRRDRKERAPARPERPIMGEKSTTYLSMSEAQISLCAALYPKARIVCLVRDPVARAWSHIKHDGLGALGEHPHRLYEQPYWQSMDAYIRHGRYELHLARWARRYPPEQIHLVDFARLGADADGVHRDVLAHIGAAPTAEPEVPERVNQSTDSAPPARLKAILERAYANDRFDIPWLRQVMEEAAADAARRRRPPKPQAGRAGADAQSVAAE